jgi:hypothetical protein
MLERMPSGKGLYTHPILLRAVLLDAGYPANALFEADDDTPLKAEMVLGQGTAEEIRRIIAETIRATERPMRQVGIKRRISAAFTVLFCARSFHTTKKYEDALTTLFFSYSLSNLGLYPHGRIRSMQSIDWLAKYQIKSLNEEQRKLLGSVLVLAFLIFEIERITYSLLAYTEKCKNRPEEVLPEVIGFIFEDKDSQSSIRHNLITIDSIFTDIVKIIIASDILPEFQIPENTLKYSIELLERLLSFKFKENESNDSDFMTLIFNNIINLHTKYQYHLYVKIDSNIVNSFDEVHYRLWQFVQHLNGKMTIEELIQKDAQKNQERQNKEK